MGEGRRSPHFYPCHHLAQWAGPVHGGREQVTTIVPLSPFSTQVWVTSWGKEVGHHNFTLVTIQHTGLGQFMGEGSRSPQLYPCHHLAQRAGSLHGGRKQVTTILPLSPFSTEGWASSWEREQVTNILSLSPFSTEGWASSWGKGVGHHNCTRVTIQHRGLGQFMGKRSSSPKFFPCHHLAQRAGQVHGGGSRSPHFLLGNHLAQRAGPVNGEREQVTTILPLSPFNTQVWSISWGKGVAHQNFTLVTIQHRGLGKVMGEGVGHQHFTLVTIQQRGIGQFMGEGRRSPHFYPCHHLAQWAGPVHGGREQVTTIVPLSPFSTQVWVTSWGKEVGHHNFTLVTIQHISLGQFMGEGSRTTFFTW